HRARCADAPGPSGGAHGAAHGKLPQRPPDALLEGCAADVQGKIEAETRVLDHTRDFSGQRLGVRMAAEQTYLREALAQIALEERRTVAHENCAHPLRAAGDENVAQRGPDDRKAYVRARDRDAIGPVPV